MKKIPAIYSNNQKIKKALSSIINFITLPLPSFSWGIGLRGFLYSCIISKCGKNLKVSSQVNIHNPESLNIGDNVFIGFNSYLGNGSIVLQDEVTLGPFVTMTAGTHLFKNGSVRFGGYKTGKIIIGKGSWIGAHSTITSGVTIGKGCLIAAGSVVTKDVEDFSVVAGVPAKFIKENNKNSM